MLHQQGREWLDEEEVLLHTVAERGVERLVLSALEPLEDVRVQLTVVFRDLGEAVVARRDDARVALSSLFARALLARLIALEEHLRVFCCAAAEEGEEAHDLRDDPPAEPELLAAFASPRALISRGRGFALLGVSGSLRRLF